MKQQKRTEKKSSPPFAKEPSDPIEDSQDLEAILGEESDETEGTKTPADYEQAISSLGFQLAQNKQMLETLTQELPGIHEELARMKTDEQVMTDLHNRCRQLDELHYEREFLRPCFLGQIGIADRCRQQISNIEQLRAKHTGKANTTVVKALKYLLEARKADLIETENFLANYGVEPFENLGKKFDPASQKCIRRVECTDQALDGRIVERLLPGYRRDNKLLRQEYVSVYVFVQQVTNNQGEHT